jgi:beta-glucosidase
MILPTQVARTLRLSPRRAWLLLLAGSAIAQSACVRERAPSAPSSSVLGSATKSAHASDAAHLPKIENGPWMNASLPSSERVNLLLKEMTTGEKLALLVGYFGADASWKNYQPPAEARPGSAGYVPGNARLGIPAQWQTDAGIGVATQGSAKVKLERTALPSGLSTAASWDPELAARGGAMIGAEARASGFNVMLAGGVNLLRDAYNGRNFEYGGEDPFLAGTIVGSSIAGIQSAHVISTMKHFAVNDQETDRTNGDSLLDTASARMSDLLAFEFALEIGSPGAVMCAYNKVNGTYACEHPELLTKVLRQDWGFRGYVMSDWGAVHSTVAAARSGLEQASGFPFDEQPYFLEPLKEAVETGAVSKERLDEMAGRILWSMFEHGLFEHPVPSGELAPPLHASITRTSAEEGAVLLRNRGGLLPLPASIKKIALIGGYADKGVLSGGGSSQVYPKGGNAVPGLSPSFWPGPVVYYPSSPLSELKRLFNETEVAFASQKDTSRAVALAKESDVAIVVCTQWATESIDTTIQLPENQDALIEAVAGANANTIVVLETGGPVLMPWAEKVASILEVWYPGTEGGVAIARLLSGAVNPSGHLPLTIARTKDQLAHPNPPKPGKVNYFEGATVGYKWFDKQRLEPLFPFGHGLSYTTFAHENFQAKVEKNRIIVQFTVRNSGSLPGKEVSQIYVSGAGWEAPQRLGAFQKVGLSPGESKQVALAVDPRLVATFRQASGTWQIAEGPIEVRLGASSREILGSAKVELRAEELPARDPASKKAAQAN